MTPKKLDQKVVDLLLPRLENEWEAAYFYRAASNYCANVGYKFAAKYFEEESKSELEHAKGIEDFLVGWNIIPNLPEIDKPVLKFRGLVDIIEQSYAIEYELDEAYEKTSMDIFKVPDLSVFDFLQTYRKIQTDSVREYSDMLNELALFDSTNKFQLLLWEERQFEK
jgi:ferritin